MLPQATCPSTEMLERFARGELSPPEVEQWAEHVERCDQCTDSIQGLQVDDTVIGAMKNPGDAAKDRRHELVVGLIERLRRIQPSVDVGEAGAELATPKSSGTVPDPVHQGTKTWDFLAPPQQPGDLGRLGPYRILQVLGAGGMGVVFRAFDPHLQRLVALKAMLPTLGGGESARKRFTREAQAAAAIEHDHIVPIYQVGEDRGVPFIAMQFLQGEPLDERLKREPCLPTTEVVRIGLETVEGLAAAHRRGLIHRDIKPGNLWLETKDEGRRMKDEAQRGSVSSFIPHPSSFRVKILDFGLARGVGDDAHLTQTGAIIGTPAYMAPEQASGKPVDHRCDLFSLGCVLYRMCTGEMPFKGADTFSVLAALARDTPPPPVSRNPDVPAKLSDLVMRLLAKKPEERPESAQWVLERLREIGAETGATVVRPGKGNTSSDGKRSRRRKWLLLAGAAACGLGIAVFLYRQTVPTSDPTSEPGEFVNSIGMKLVRIAPGKFTRGSPKDEIGRNPDEEQHEVEITRPFYMGAHEVRLMDFQQFVDAVGYRTDAERDGQGGEGFDPAIKFFEDRKPQFTWKNTGFRQSPSHPVLNVSWNDATAFCLWLSGKEGKTYDLPTEAEWEYACRAGSNTRYCSGDSYASLEGFCNHADASLKAVLDPARTKTRIFAAWNDGHVFTAPVGSYKPNAWGLFDMHGNVYEWCKDWQDRYPTGTVRDPEGPPFGTHRVVRGGSFWSNFSIIRCAHRFASTPNHRYSTGFRVVLRLPPPPTSTGSNR